MAGSGLAQTHEDPDDYHSSAKYTSIRSYIGLPDQLHRRDHACLKKLGRVFCPAKGFRYRGH